MTNPSPFPPVHVQVTSIEIVEPAPGEKGRVERGPREQVRKLTDAQIAAAFGVAERLAAEAGAMLGRLRAQPDQAGLSGLEVEFGLGFNTELQVYLVGAKADASLHVKLTWQADRAG